MSRHISGGRAHACRLMLLGGLGACAGGPQIRAVNAPGAYEPVA